MSSNSSDAYQALIDVIAGVFTSHKRLTNPYQTEENSVLILEKAWGVGLLDAVNTLRNMGSQSSFEQRYSVTLCRRVRANESDIVAKTTGEKTLLDDWETMVINVDGSSLNMPTLIAKCQVVSHNGIQTVFVDKDNFIKIETIVQVEYFIGLACC